MYRVMFLLATIASAQTFEVASVKPVEVGNGPMQMMGCSAVPDTAHPATVACQYASLQRLITMAYDIRGYQIAGPSWLDSQLFNIDAKLAPGSTRDQMQIMLQNLLKDRFGMVQHKEQREIPVYVLSKENTPPKLKVTLPDTATDAPPTGQPPPMGPDGFPILSRAVLARGPITLYRNGRARLQGINVTMEALTRSLTNELDRLIVDETGLTGKYDVTLEWAHDPRPIGGLPIQAQSESTAAAPELGDLFVAVSQQLGLKLTRAKRTVEVIVIDKIEKTPTQN